MAGEFLALGESGAGFAVGDLAVVDTALLNCRTGPGIGYDLIYTMSTGTGVQILADGHAWYKVQTRDGQLGWVTGIYLAAAPALGFVVGDAVRVIDGALNLRADPGLSATVLRVMADNEALLIRGGPVEADGYTWYRVRNDAGEGWAAGEFLRSD